MTTRILSLKSKLLSPKYGVLIGWIVLAVIYWGNIFRFHPSMINLSYDGTSETLVIGRMARAAADGLFRNTDLGSNYDPQHPLPPGEAAGAFGAQGFPRPRPYR